MTRRGPGAGFLFAGLLSLAAPAARADDPPNEKAVGAYVNPLDVLVADPFVLLDDGIYYLYGTHAEDGFLVRTSRDLANWTSRGHAFERTATSFGRRLFWAHRDEAISAAQAALALEPNNQGVVNDLGRSLFEAGRFDEAREVLP